MFWIQIHIFLVLINITGYSNSIMKHAMLKFLCSGKCTYSIVHRMDAKANYYRVMKCFFNYISIVALLLSVLSCTEIPGLGSIASDIGYENQKQYVISGMADDVGDFEESSSTLPLTFEIENVYEADGQDVSPLSEEISVVQYSEPITGGESEEELLLKVDTVQMPAVSIGEHSGTIEIQEGNNIPAGEYHFDIKVSNTSGSEILEDALIIVFEEYEVLSYSDGMAQEPEIERVADTPYQVLFTGYLDGVALSGDRIDFTENRSDGFEGTFVNDTDEGELWEVTFPVDSSDTYCTWKIINKGMNGEDSISYETEDFSFVLGRPGSYEIKLYK